MRDPAERLAQAAEEHRPELQVLAPAVSVDLRILQANERTLLAWIRTGMTLMAFGFVVARIGLWLHASGPAAPSGAWHGGVGAGFVALGTLTNVLATARYLKVRQAILESRAIHPGNALILTLVGGLVLLGAGLMAYLLVS